MQSDSVMQQHVCKDRECYLSQQLVELADSKFAPMLQDEAKQSDFGASGQLPCPKRSASWALNGPIAYMQQFRLTLCSVSQYAEGCLLW